MTDNAAGSPRPPTGDLPAIAAYAVNYDLDGEAAEVEWRLTTERERAKHRDMAAAAVTVAALHTAPPAALSPAVPPDADALAEVYWLANQAVAPLLRGGRLPLEKLGPARVEATKAGVLAVVSAALPSVGILDEALRKACEERDAARAELRREVTDHAQFADELLENTGDEPDIGEAPEDFALRYWRGLEAENGKHQTRLAMLLADTPFEFRPDWEHEYDDVPVPDGTVEIPAEDDSASVDIGSPEDGDYDRCEPTL